MYVEKSMNIFNLASLDKEYPPKVAQLWIYVVILYELFVLKILHELAGLRLLYRQFGLHMLTTDRQ
jgi:hypothetical protein